MDDNVNGNSLAINPVADPAEQSAQFTSDIDPAAREINAAYARFLRNQSAAIADALVFGRGLLAKKDSLAHREWTPWFDSNVKEVIKLSLRRCEEFMRFAYRVDAMPDLLPKLTDKTFQAAEKLVDAEWRRRGMKALNDIVACEREIAEAHAAINRAVTVLQEMQTTRRIDDGVEVTDDSEYQAWLRRYELTPEIVIGWSRTTGAMFNTFGKRRGSAGELSRTVPAGAFPDAARRREEEAVAEAVQPEDLAPVTIAAKTEDMNAADRFAAGRYQPDPDAEQLAILDDSDGEDEPA